MSKYYSVKVIYCSKLLNILKIKVSIRITFKCHFESSPFFSCKNQNSVCNAWHWERDGENWTLRKGRWKLDIKNRISRPVPGTGRASMRAGQWKQDIDKWTPEQDNERRILTTLWNLLHHVTESCHWMPSVARILIWTHLKLCRSAGHIWWIQEIVSFHLYKMAVIPPPNIT